MEAVNGWFYVLRLKCNMESDPFIQLQWVNCFYSSYFCFLFHEQLPVLVILHDGMVSVSHGWQVVATSCRWSSSLSKLWSWPVLAHLSWGHGSHVIVIQSIVMVQNYWSIWLKSTAGMGLLNVRVAYPLSKGSMSSKTINVLHISTVRMYCVCVHICFRRGTCTVYILMWMYVYRPYVYLRGYVCVSLH